MSTYIHDLLDPAELQKLMEERRIGKQVHPDLPISIYNYTAAAQYRNIWTNSERICRGLIVEDGTGRVIARGPSKFMNYGDPKAPEVTMDTLVTVTRKEDGSLGIGWKYNGQYGIATRGSFLSDQALHATAMIDDEIRQWIDWNDEDNSTVIYEIVYPENRIVLDYKGRDELIRLGNVDNVRGVIGHRGGVLHWLIRMEDALKLEIPADEEGYVLDIHEDRYTGEGRNKVHHITTLGHIKLKGEEYKILHGLLTNTNARRIWVQLAARDCHEMVERLAIRNDKEIDKVWATYLGWDPADFKRVDVTKDITETLLTNVPDEFYDWVTKKIDSINDNVSDLIIQAIMLGGQIALVDDKRKRHELVKDHPLCKEILAYVEDRNIDRITMKAWKMCQPEGDETPFKQEDD